MLNKKIACHKKAQSLIEYSALLAILVAALLAMFTYLRFSFQGRIKESADVFGRGEQYTPDGPDRTRCYDETGKEISC